jgi:hypothetical protein
MEFELVIRTKLLYPMWFEQTVLKLMALEQMPLQQTAFDQKCSIPQKLLLCSAPLSETMMFVR